MLKVIFLLYLMNYSYLSEFENLISPYLPDLKDGNFNIQIKNCSDYIKYLLIKKLTNNGKFINHSYTYTDTGNPKCKEVIINFCVFQSFYYFTIPNNHEFIREYTHGIKKYLNVSNLDSNRKIIFNMLDDININLIIKDSHDHFLIFYNKPIAFFPFINFQNPTYNKKNDIFKSFFNRNFNEQENVYFKFNDEIEFLFLYIKILIKNPNYVINDPIINIITESIYFKSYKDLRDKIQKIFIYNIDLNRIFKLVHILLPNLSHKIIDVESFIEKNFNKKRKGTYYLEYFFINLKKELT